MCGIFGYKGFNKTELARARKALNTLMHRGPDQWGDWFDEETYIGHRRLSIIDLSENAIQPFGDERAVLAVNGEIYNFKELRKELEGKYIFKSLSDSEVLLHGYKEWGIDDLLKRIDGMYAFCIYDKKSRTLFLVRDRFGKKPLFYTENHGRFMFSSEIKAFFEFDDTLRVFSYRGIKDWIYHRGSHSSQTIFHSIQRLEPGCYLKINNSQIRKRKYYDVLDHIDNGHTGIKKDLGLIEELLNKAVKKRLISDVPVGLQLSGGIDSSLIGYFLSLNHSGSMHTFNVGFKEPRYENYSEEKYAKLVANKYGFIHHQLNISIEDIAQNFEEVIYLVDGMLDYPNTIPIYLLSSFAKKYVTVILTGEGADELFGGYTKFKRMDSLSRYDNLSSLFPYILIDTLGKTKAKRLAREIYLKKKFSGKTRSILESMNCYITPETFTRIFGENKDSLFDEIPYEYIERHPFYKQLLIMDHKTYLFSLLERQDRASMGASMESRLPFLDTMLIENSFNFSKDHLFSKDQNKIVLKKISEKIYGKDFTYRPKKGFPLPLTEWLENRQGFKSYLKKVFNNDFLLFEKIDMEYLKQYLNSKSFDNKLLNYGDSERIWIKWFLMVIRTAQDVFRISEVR